ncbi:MAG: SGNH/GDSL hydrolase family protein [Cyanobacteriota bacterium]
MKRVVWLLFTMIVAVAIATVHQSFDRLAFAQDQAVPHQQAINSLTQQQAADFALKDGDRIVFFGDSITEARLYTTYIEHYVVTHYPDRRVTFFNTGWSCERVTGNNCGTSPGALARVEQDVIDYQPTVVTLLFGMNDGQYKNFDPATLKVYEDGLSAIIQKLKAKTRARIYVMTSTAYDQINSPSRGKAPPYNDVLKRYSEAAKQIALREGLPVIDLHSVTTETLRQAQAKDPKYTFIPDRIHPNEDGHLIMATEILRFWGASPKGVEIGKKVDIGQNKTTSFSISAPLPWPFPSLSEKIRNLKPEVMEMGQVNLKITGLPPGKYGINIDGEDAGEYTAEKLSSGIAVSSMSEQAQALSRLLVSLVRQRSDIFYLRWRDIKQPLSGADKRTASLVSTLKSLEKEMEQRIPLLGQLHEYRLLISAKT